MLNYNKIFFLLLFFVLFLIYFNFENVINEKLSISFHETNVKNAKNNTVDVKYPTIFCFIKTHPNNIKINKTLNLYRVWGYKCDNYRFITLLPDHLRPKSSSETIEVFQNFYMIQPKYLSSESHGNLTLKMYYSMIYVYEKFPLYDWYYIVDDDAYLNMENLKEFLKDKPKNISITYGYNFKVIVKGGYHSGGPGYLLSRQAFVSISREMVKDIRNCPNSGIDDVDINDCVRKYNGTMGNSRDNNDRERFLPMGLMNHFLGQGVDWLFSYGEMGPKKGLDCCADSLIAVHYMQAMDVFRLDLAIQTQKENSKLYDKFFGLKKPVTFKNIIKNYILLQDLELDSNKYKELVNI